MIQLDEPLEVVNKSSKQTVIILGDVGDSELGIYEGLDYYAFHIIHLLTAI